MAIPIGPLKPLLDLYRNAWREAGHPGDGEVMIAFHMFCHEDARAARDIPRRAFDLYFEALVESAGEWTQGTASKDYQGYDKSIGRMKGFSLEGQVETGNAWVGTPDEIKAIIRRFQSTVGKFEHASLQINFGTLDFAEAQKSMRLFAREVMPEFVSSSGTSMPAGIPTHPELLLVGSVALQSAEDVFRAVSNALGDRIKRIPDGETGSRSLWVYWPRRVLERNDAFEIDPEEGARGTRATSEAEGVRRWIGNDAAKQGEPPPPRMRLRAGVYPSQIELGPLGYAEVAAESYAVFRRLRDDDVIPRDIKFQVSLPTTAAFLNAHVVYSQHAVIEPIYRAKLLAEVHQMVRTIAPSDLAVQWDVSTEMAQWEGVRHAYFDDVKKA